MFFHRTTVRMAAAVLCAAALGVSVSADGGASGLRGACVTAVPSEGAVRLGDRVIRPGDVLTADQLRQLTFSGGDTQAVMGYLPIGADGLGEETELVFSIHGKKISPPPPGIPGWRPTGICPTRGFCPSATRRATP